MGEGYVFCLSGPSPHAKKMASDVTVLSRSPDGKV